MKWKWNLSSIENAYIILYVCVLVAVASNRSNTQRFTFKSVTIKCCNEQKISDTTCVYNNEMVKDDK